MHIKIYAGEKPIYLTDTLTADLKSLSEKKGTLMYSDEKKIDGQAVVSASEGKKINAVIIRGKNFEILKKDFFDQFELIEAAGGIVQNEKKDVLFIFRRGKWDLPKGKKEAGEDAETCAEREIEEETGVKNLSLKRKAGETFHIYSERGKQVLKITDWFYFTSGGKQTTAAQVEEDITEVKWIPTQKIKEPMANTYENIRDVMREFFDAP